MQTRHDEFESGGFRCEDGRVATFKRFVTDPTRCAQSFGFAEVHLLHAIVIGVQRGTDLSVVIRNPLMQQLAGKIITMRVKSKAAAQAITESKETE